MLSKHNLDFACGMTMTDEEHELEVILLKGTPYIILAGELWDVFCEDFGQIWPCYKGTALY